MMPDTVFIYALNCPVTGRTRYIGKSKNPNSRLTKHLYPNRQEKNHKANWVKALVVRGIKPLLEILDEVPIAEWPMWEVAYIQFFRDAGFELTNGNDGGEGGCNPTLEVREKLRMGATGRKHTAIGRANISAGHLGQIPWNLGKSTPEQTRAKQRLAKLGKKRGPISEETRVKMSAARTAFCKNLRVEKEGILNA